MEQYLISAETHVGSIRKKNEDNFFINGIYKERKESNFSYDGLFLQKETSVIGLFDGMGGLENGDKASYIAVKVLNKYFEYIKKNKSVFNSDFVLRKINKRICREINQSSEKMGSTAVLLFCEDSQIRISNIGDSRAYLYRGGVFRQISVDHTEQSSMLRMQEQLGIERIIDIPSSKNTLTQHLGIQEDEFILEPADSEVIRVQKKDIYLLCSDGLTGMLQDTEISDVLSCDIDLQNKKKILIEKAMQAGGKDNITVILIEVKK